MDGYLVDILENGNEETEYAPLYSDVTVPAAV